MLGSGNQIDKGLKTAQCKTCCQGAEEKVLFCFLLAVFPQGQDKQKRRLHAFFNKTVQNNRTDKNAEQTL